MSKLLSQGGFGCVYYPGIQCSGKISKNKNYVTKLQKKDFNADNEIYIGDLVKKVGNYDLFFIPVVKSCNVNLSSINKKDLEECEVIKGETDMDYKIMDLPYVENADFYGFLTEADKGKKEILLAIMETYSYLLNSIKKLIEIHVVHFDLKSPNILYNSATKNPLIIDFGISLPINIIKNNNMHDYFYANNPDYYIWPLEVHAINYLVNENENLTKSSIEFIANKFVHANTALNIFSEKFKKDYKTACIKELEKFLKKPKQKTIDDLFNHWPTWDNYSISIIYLKIIDFISKKGFYRNKLIIRLSQLLLDNISPNIKKRKSIDDTIKTYRDLFYIDEKVINYDLMIDNFSKETFTEKAKKDPQLKINKN